MTTHIPTIISAVEKYAEASVLTETFNTAAQKNGALELVAISGQYQLYKDYLYRAVARSIDPIYPYTKASQQDTPPILFIQMDELDHPRHKNESIEARLQAVEKMAAQQHAAPVIILQYFDIASEKTRNKVLSHIQGAIKSGTVIIDTHLPAASCAAYLKESYTAITLPSYGPQKPLGYGAG